MALIPASDKTLKDHTELSTSDLITITNRAVAIARLDADRRAFDYGSSFIESAQGDPNGGFWNDLADMMWDPITFGPMTSLLLAECASRNLKINTDR